MDIPTHLMGWAGPEVAAVAYGELEQEFITFAFDGEELTKPGTPIWEFAKRVNGGKHIEVLKQETGDCVGCGAAQAGEYMAAYEIARLGQEEEFKRWYHAFIYAVSRVAPECGNGRLRGAGSTGAWAAVAMKKYGVLFWDDPEVPTYSGRLADQWGSSGPPKKFYDLAADNLVGSAAKITTVDDIRRATMNYHPVTIASGQGFDMTPVEYKGYHVFRPRGSWMHQMCYLAWMDDPFPAAYRYNSWGVNAHGKPLNGEPPGGAWQHAADIEKELKQHDCELFALSLFEGFQGKANFNIL